MSEGDQLLGDILAEPGDDGLRLIYADWLEDNGDPDGAEFIRVQLAMAGGECPACGRRGSAHAGGCALARRANELCTRNLLGFRFHSPSPAGKVAWALTTEGCAALEPCAFASRGFVSRVRCPLGGWLDHGPAIVRRHPVQRVEIADARILHTDRGPGFDGWGFILTALAPGSLDKWVQSWTSWNKWWPTQESAEDALSADCLAWAKTRPAPSSLSSP